jgi:transcriptional regulator with XRE-family HTH domain
MVTRGPVRSYGSKKHLQLFAKRLHELRVASGMSQERFAEMAGIHRNYIGRLERGEQNPSLDMICVLAVALKVKPAALLDKIS